MKSWHMTLLAGVALSAAALPATSRAQTNQTPGVYVGIQAGLNFMRNMRPYIPGTYGDTTTTGYTIGGVVGYDFAGPRVELEIPYRNNAINSNIGVSRVESIAMMINALYDFGPDWFVSPHIGAGIGIARVSRNQTEFAYQAIVGLSMNFDAIRVSLDYKYFATTNPAIGNNGYRYQNHSAMLSVAYKFGAPAPAPPPPAPPPPPPPPTSFLVFFDFDRSNITPTAMTTIQQAVASAKSGNRTRIGVTGHADRSGSDAYNMALSLRRANAVKDVMVQQGIPAANIAVVGRGESQPLVQTADGVREPQNRRVEIVLQ